MPTTRSTARDLTVCPAAAASSFHYSTTASYPCCHGSCQYNCILRAAARSADRLPCSSLLRLLFAAQLLRGACHRRSGALRLGSAATHQLMRGSVCVCVPNRCCTRPSHACHSVGGDTHTSSGAAGRLQPLVTCCNAGKWGPAAILAWQARWARDGGVSDLPHDGALVHQRWISWLCARAPGAPCRCHHCHCCRCRLYC